LSDLLNSRMSIALEQFDQHHWLIDLRHTHLSQNELSQ
jgi:hypothetical protein